MKLLKKIRNFGRSEAGAVTVDWVVLTAAIVALGMIVLGQIRGSAETLAGKISSYVSQQNVTTP